MTLGLPETARLGTVALRARIAAPERVAAAGSGDSVTALRVVIAYADRPQAPAPPEDAAARGTPADRGFPDGPVPLTGLRTRRAPSWRPKRSSSAPSG
jgi:hypothetical protein